MRGRPALAVVLLAAGTFALYLPVREFSFLGYDDASVLVLNRHLRDGLTWEGVRCAFTTSYLSNWNPVTWISHLADVSLFGMDAGAHHLVNAALHALGAALLLLFLRQAGPEYLASARFIDSLHLAQTGRKHEQAKQLKGFGGAGVLEVVEDFRSDTYRAAYAVKFGDAVYVLHCFQQNRATASVRPDPISI